MTFGSLMLNLAISVLMANLYLQVILILNPDLSLTLFYNNRH
jgi:hypothetical protein